MALIHMDGFSTYGTTGNISSALSRRYSVFSPGTGVTCRAGRSAGKFAFSIDGADSKVGVTRMSITGTNSFPNVTGETRIYGFWFWSNITANHNYFQFPGDSVSAMAIRFGGGEANVVSFQFNTETSVTANANWGSYFYFANSTWHHIECVVTKTGTSDATFTLFLNGTQVTTFSGIIPSTISVPVLFKKFNGTQATYTAFSEFYILSGVTAPNARIGPTASVTTLRPTAAVGADVWTPTGAATNALAVSDNPIASKFMTAPGTGSAQVFDFDDMGADVSDVSAAQIVTSQKGTTGAAFNHRINDVNTAQANLITSYVTSVTTISGLSKAGINSLTAGVSS